MTPQPRRKKWTEAEERTLIDKYGEMACDGTLSKMKTREKKYKPIALHVNSMHNVRDPVSYPWQWTWKDVSTKVQNMRHQYALVKQKIKKQESSIRGLGEEEFDWMEGITHWSNFLRYKEVFGDVPIAFTSTEGVVGGNECNGGFEGIVQFGQLGQVGDGAFVGGIDGVENGVMALEFDYDGDEGEENYNRDSKSEGCMREDGGARFVCEDIEPSASDMRKKRKLLKGLEKKAWGFLVNQLGHLKEMESRFEQRELDRERERKHLQVEKEKDRERKCEEMEKDREVRENAREKLRRQRIQEWEAMERESEERERRRRDEELMHEREWEERLNRRRSEWKKRMNEMLSQHRAEMGQIQARILHEQQDLTNQFLGLVSQWSGHPTGLSDHTGATSHYLSQMMQNLHHVNGMVHGDARVEGDSQEDQFIVDG